MDRVSHLSMALMVASVLTATGARLITAVALHLGFSEANPFASPATLGFGGLIILGVGLVFLTFPSLYREVALSTILGVEMADFAHDLLTVLRFSPYTAFACSIATAILPILLVSFWALLQLDPRREKLTAYRRRKLHKGGAPQP